MPDEASEEAPSDLPAGRRPAFSDDPQFRKELTRAMRSLARRADTAARVRARLLERGLPADWTDEILSQLNGHGFLDDARYAASYARGRLERGYGSARIRRELEEGGINERLVDSALAGALSEIDEVEVLRSVIAKRLRTHGEPKTAGQLKNLSNLLLRRGFGSESVRAELEQWFKSVF